MAFGENTAELFIFDKYLLELLIVLSRPGVCVLRSLPTEGCLKDNNIKIKHLKNHIQLKHFATDTLLLVSHRNSFPSLKINLKNPETPRAS